MSSVFEQLRPEEIGERLRVARDGERITQADAANKLGIARTTIVAIEQGQRRARLEELQQLAALYNTSVNALLRRESVHVDLKPRFRKAGEHGAEVETSAGILTKLVEAELELENLLGVRRSRNDPPERPLMPGDVILQAEQAAFELRQWMGIGLAPVHDLVALLELQLGVRVFVRKLPANISGLYAFTQETGACILLNAIHPPERRTQTVAHELGHFISTRREPDALYEGSPEASRDERYANAFARAFLTPARTVMSKFQDVTAGATQLTRRHVIVLAHTFGVSREAMVRRLEELKLVRRGTWDWFVGNGGISNEHVRQVFGDKSPLNLPGTEEVHRLPLRLSVMIGEAWRRSLLSEGQIARLLEMDRSDVRELLDTWAGEGGETDALRLPE